MIIFQQIFCQKNHQELTRMIAKRAKFSKDQSKGSKLIENHSPLINQQLTKGNTVFLLNINDQKNKSNFSNLKLSLKCQVHPVPQASTSFCRIEVKLQAPKEEET